MIECGYCGKRHRNVTKVPTDTGFYWVCIVCRKMNYERGSALIVFMLTIGAMCFLIWLFIEPEKYYCDSYRECQSLCSLTEWHDHRIVGSGEVPSFLSDNDLILTQELNR